MACARQGLPIPLHRLLGATVRAHAVRPYTACFRYAVEVVRDPLTGDVLPGLNGEPFQIAARGAVALQGVLQ